MALINTFVVYVCAMLIVTVNTAAPKNRRIRKCTISFEKALNCSQRLEFLGDRSIIFPKTLNEMDTFCKYVIQQLFKMKC